MFAPIRALHIAEQQPSVVGERLEKLLAQNFHPAARASIATTLLLALFACGGGGSDSSAPVTSSAFAPTRPVEFSDLEIAQRLFADSQRTPSSFLKEVPPAYPGYISTAHLKNTDITPSTTSAPYELCTDDWSVALGWSDQTAAALSASLLVESNATPRYHEFSRVRTGTPQGYVRTRIYRCSYLDRSTADLRDLSGAAGTFNQRPLDLAELQQLVEYLWQFTTYNNYGHAVLKSSGVSTSANLEHTLIIASLASTPNASGCDRIDVIGWTHSANPQNGALTRRIDALWEFGAKRAAGLVELCNPY